MELEALHLRQHDGVTCGPTVAVVAGALMDARYRAGLQRPGWFAAEQQRVHAEINRLWPRRLGTTPSGMARALNDHSVPHGVRYRWRPVTRRRLPDLSRAVGAGWPVALLIGRFVPRHWVLLVEGRDDDGLLRCYEPSSGAVRAVATADIRRARLQGLGYPRAFAVVLPDDVPSPPPSDSTRAATA
jgi:hypothetical protein